LPGCTSDSDNQPSATPSQTPALEDAQAFSSSDMASPSPVPIISPGAQPTEKHAEGIYIGQIDNNTIEVSIDGTPTAFRLNAITQMQISALTDGQFIGFSYSENDAGQKTILRFDETPQTMIAEYAGQMDTHTIEVTTENGPVAFQLAGEALKQVESLSVGDTIEITYIMNASGQNVASALVVK
jgi:hypothetical protein